MKLGIIFIIIKLNVRQSLVDWVKLRYYLQSSYQIAQAKHVRYLC